MKPVAAGSFAGQLKTLRESAGFTQEELATIAGLSVHAISSLERGERRRPQTDTVRALSSALGLAAVRDPHFVASTIGEGLGLNSASAADLPARARAACEHQPTLLVIDNFE